MTALVDVSDFIAKVTASTAERIYATKTARIAGAAATALVIGQKGSLWLYEGAPGAGAVPTTVAVPDNTTNGGIFQTNPAGGTAKYLTGLAMFGIFTCGVQVYDRLLHIGGLSGTNTGAQTVGGAITRNTGGAGNRIFAEIYTQIGVTPTTITAAYTNQAGAAKTTLATTFGGSSYREKTRLIELPLAVGDTGVRGVTSVTVLGSTGTAGDFGITIAKPLWYGTATYPYGSDFSGLVDDGGPVLIESGACIAMWVEPHSGATTYEQTLEFTMVQS